jgi:hypothetical protein
MVFTDREQWTKDVPLISALYGGRRMATSLLNDLMPDSVDQSELELLLQIHFGMAKSESPEEIHYFRTNEQAALVLHYEDGALEAICPGTGLKEHDIPELQSKVKLQLLAEHPAEIGQIVLFAYLRNDGWFRYGDVFQLVPVPADAPRLEFQIGDHPLMLQYKVSGSSDLQIAGHRRMRVGRELELLCVALTPAIHGGIGNVLQHHWSIIRSQDPLQTRSEYCQEGYTYPSANGIAPNFDLVKGLSPISRVPAAEYYCRIGISIDQRLELPDTFEQCLSAHFNAPREQRDRFMRASYWFQYAQRVSNISRSGAFTALVSAVEALLPAVTPEAKCVTCSRSFGIGPTKQFINFVEKHAPDPAISNSDRRQLYALRSALSHGGKLLHSDSIGWGSAMTSVGVSDWVDERALWLTVRLVLVNWLLDSATSAK